MGGDEVVQMYVCDVVSSTTTYEKNLRGFRRVHLNPGETRRIQFTLSPEDLVLLNTRGEKVVEEGEFRVMIGSSYNDIRLSNSFWIGENSQGYSLPSIGKVKMMDDPNLD